MNLHIPSTDERLLFFDDFNSNQLDRSKWNVQKTGDVVNNEQQAYIDSEETIYTLKGDNDEGILAIHPHWKPGYKSTRGQIFDFVSGRIDTHGKFDFTYGSISACIKLPAGSGLWPAFWVLGAGKWPTCGEIDIMENIGEPDWISAAVHGPGFYGDRALVNNKYFASENDVTRWHIYTVDWTPDESLIFKVDNELIYRVTRPMVHTFGPWVFSNPKYIILNFAVGGGYPNKINNIRHPYFGLPEETVQLIRSGEVRMLIDWVMVNNFR